MEVCEAARVVDGSLVKVAGMGLSGTTTGGSQHGAPAPRAENALVARLTHAQNRF
jgi:hypothetical protein